MVLSHVDRAKSVDYNRAVLDTGVRVEYDSAFRWKKGETNHTFLLLEKLLPEFPHQITLGMDMAKNAYWKSYGGNPGLKYLIESIPRFLNSKGLEEYYQRVFFDNPAETILLFRPPGSKKVTISYGILRSVAV